MCSRYKYLCGGECIGKSLPCEGVCLDPDDRVCDGSCISKDQAWDCSGECQNIDKPCNGVCAHHKLWECSGECVDVEKPCNGECHAGHNLCGYECLPKHKQWDCNGECQSQYDTCNGVCPMRGGNVSHIQESYLKCPTYEQCFLLGEMCNTSKQNKDSAKNCMEDYIYLSDKLCDRFPPSDIIINCDEAICKESKQCIEENKICNGVIDCFDRSDESLCSKNSKTELDFSIFTECETKDIWNTQYKGFKCGDKCIPYEN